MIFLRKFNDHTSYEAEINRGGVDFKIPNVSYCKNVDDVHFNPYSTIEFYVGKITPPQTVKIYTDSDNFIPIQVSEGNKWYSYLLPKDKGLYKIYGDSVKKVVVKADITTSGETIIPDSTVEVSFKGSNTSKVTNMFSMFDSCRVLTSLDLSSFDTSNVTKMFNMFYGCGNLKSLDLSSFDTSSVTDMVSMFEGCVEITSLDLSGWDISDSTFINDMFLGCGNLKTITMIGCGQTTIDKIKAQLAKDNITGFTIVTK